MNLVLTREKTKELLPVFTAWANGEVVQIRQTDDQENQWIDLSQPHETLTLADWLEYRAKPREVVVTREILQAAFSRSRHEWENQVTVESLAEALGL